MKHILLLLLAFLAIPYSNAQVSISKDADGMRLMVNGKPLMVNGVNWDYVPIGSTITDPGIWSRSDDVIKAALDSEMSLLRNMGVNAIRTYGLKPKWVEYIYDNYGIYTMLNITFGAYGLTINGGWVPQTDYSDPDTRAVLMKEATEMAETYKDTRGLLIYMIGNENNYHLSWTGAETEAIPIEDQGDGIRVAARALYRAFNDATKEVKKIDSSHPVAICNGDLLYLDIVKEECTDIDIYGTNMYRGISFGDAFQKVKDELDMPVLFAEFGGDAFNARDNQEDQLSQAYYNVGNWKEIYLNAAGLDRAANSIGGFTFQFSDGWWKYAQTKNLSVHDNIASWPNGGYSRDQNVETDNNMNEEWFGICAKGPTDARGLYQLYPRAAYYALKEAHSVNPVADGMSTPFLTQHFDNISLMEAVLQARGDKASLEGSQKKVRMSGLRAEFTTFNTGGDLLETPSNPDPDAEQFPNKLGFDFMHSYFVGVEGNPAPNMRANVNFNVLGSVAENPINEIFYETRGRNVKVNSPNGDLDLRNPNAVQVYNADFEWTAKDVDLRGFYRTGHYHWGYEGDFFGLYPEANYGPNLDIYNGEVLGVELDGKNKLNGLKAAFGPQLWWGANPALLLKYTKEVGKFQVTGVFHEDIDDAGEAISSFAVPLPQTRRLSLHLEREFGGFGFEIGGLWAGNPLNGRQFQVSQGSPGNYSVFTDKVASKDNWGGKIKLTYSKGPFNWYAQAAAMGLVANGGGDYTRTFTGWRLKDSGSGNQTNILTGISLNLGDVQIAPNFLWQKPIVGPMPNDVSAPGRLRNIQDDPFAVRANRETIAGELLFTFDPTPATWMYAWDNDMAEDAPFAASIGIVYRHLPTTQDAAIGFFANRTSFAFPNSAPAEDLWEINARLVSKPSPVLGWIANIYGGNGQANGSDERIINRFGADFRLIHKNMKLTSMLKINDWGPFDYHRDFNLTYPLQLMVDLSTALATPSWFAMPNTRMGIRYTWRSLDQYSPRYCPTMTMENGTSVCNPLASGFDNGKEWEIRTYVHINIGK
ncbi:MAG: glycosidase [Saprospiraceae bacterium]|nr:glycosidase [Saprospiraceae bacterium]